MMWVLGGLGHGALRLEYNPWLFFPSWSMPPDDPEAIKPFPGLIVEGQI
jgi:hypothetical protein